MTVVMHVDLYCHFPFWQSDAVVVLHCAQLSFFVCVCDLRAQKGRSDFSANLICGGGGGNVGSDGRRSQVLAWLWGFLFGA